MIVSSRFALDTNLLVYAVDLEAGDRHILAKDLVKRAANKDCFVTVQVLGEFFHATTRKGVASVDEAAAFTSVLQKALRVTAATQQTFNQAVAWVRDHRLSFWDAMLWATAMEAGCAFLLSEDLNHGQSLGGVEILNPFAEDSEPVLARLLG